MNKPVRPNELYEADFHAWTVQQAEALSRREPRSLDYDNLADEVLSLGRSEHRAIESDLNVVLVHLLKWSLQPQKRKGGWEASIQEHRDRIAREIERSPSLHDHPASVLDAEYRIAGRKAAAQMGRPLRDVPEVCPFTLREILDPGYLPGASLLERPGR